MAWRLALAQLLAGAGVGLYVTGVCLLVGGSSASQLVGGRALGLALPVLSLAALPLYLSLSSGAQRR